MLISQLTNCMKLTSNGYTSTPKYYPLTAYYIDLCDGTEKEKQPKKKRTA